MHRSNFIQEELEKLSYIWKKLLSNPLESSPCLFLDTQKNDASNRYSYFFEQAEKIITYRHGDNLNLFFEELERNIDAGFWAAGTFSYELGYLLEPKLQAFINKHSSSAPLIWMGFFKEPIIIDQEIIQKNAFSSDFDSFLPENGRYEIGDMEINTTKNEYVQAFAQIHDAIANGEAYQVNFTMKYRFSLQGSPLSFYRSLRQNQTVAYSAYIFDGENTVISLSPELFFRKEGTKLTAKPMKGTTSRGRFPQEDKERANQLVGDPKNRAENVMIVDMIRNDLGRLAVPGTVHVDHLLEVERFETLFQMTSTVTAQLQKSTNWKKIFASLFPCASVTGAPKIATMGIIAELEKESRGIYTGAIGYISPQGDACFNVPIRTITLNESNRGEMGIGSGIVWDSEPEKEYEECLLKANFLTREAVTFSLIETLLFEDNEYDLLPSHLTRLKESAQYFDMKCPLPEIKSRLNAIRSHYPSGKYKVRLLLQPDGSIEIQVEKLAIATHKRFRVKLSEQKVHSNDIWLYHKTTHRPLYTEERKKLAESEYDEVIFCNEKGELTEGTITSLFLEIDGKLFTPPITCGLLPGILRKKLLKERRCEEKLLFPDDIHKADKVYLGNSVRGLIEATLWC